MSILMRHGLRYGLQCAWLFVFLLAGCSRQVNSDVPNVSKSGRAHARVLSGRQTVLLSGEADTQKYRFPAGILENSRSRPLFVTLVGKSCSCLQVDYPQSLAAGEARKINLLAQAPTAYGTHGYDARLHLRWEDGPEEEVVARTDVRVVPTLVVAPPVIRFSEDLALKRQVSVTYRYRSESSRQISLPEWDRLPDGVTSHGFSEIYQKPFASGFWEVQWQDMVSAAKSRLGRLNVPDRCQLHIKVLGEQRSATGMIIVLLNGHGLRVIPEEISLNDCRPVRVAIVSRDGSDFTIAPKEVPTGIEILIHSKELKKVHFVTIQRTDGQSLGVELDSHTVRLSTTDRISPSIALRIRNSGLPRAQ